MRKIIFAIVFTIATTPIVSTANSSAPSEHAPITVMGDHLHERGEWMLSYRYMRMDMQDSRMGSKRITARDIVGTADNPGQYRVAPDAMPMDMHMLGTMFGLNDRVTLMAMLMFVSQKMSHLTRPGDSFETESSGLGDTKLGAMVGLYESSKHRIHTNLMVSLPTGSIDERDDTPVMQNAFLPYPMQLGSGTYDFNPAIVYSGQFAPRTWSWGAKLAAVIRNGTNDEGYTLGNRWSTSAWIARDVSHSLSLSLGLNYQDWEQIDGANPALNPMMIQTANPSLYGGERLDLSIGANYIFENGHRLAIEYAEPVSQSLNGPQMQLDSILTLGWQKAF